MLKIGDLFLRSGKFGKAEMVFKKCIENSPHDFRGYFNLGMTYKSLERFDEALKCMDKVIELSEETVEAYGVASGISLRQLKPQQALAYCTSCREICQRYELPEDPFCLYNLNNSLRQLDRMDEAMELSWKLLPSPPAQATIPTATAGVVDTSAITFICVKYGKKYSSDYVNALSAAISTHTASTTTAPTKLICLTDDANGIDTELVECRYNIISCDLNDRQTSSFSRMEGLVAQS